MKPLVSAAVLAYNQEELIGHTLQSVIDQDFSDLEIVVADDASTDRTVEVARELLEGSGRPFRILQAKTNEGISVNNNRLLDGCNGEFIALLGGDDLWNPNKLAVQVESLSECTECSLAAHAMAYVDELGAADVRIQRPTSRRKVLDDVKPLLGGSIRFYGSSVLIRNHPQLMRFDPRLRHASDLIYFAELMRKDGPFLLLPNVLGSYREHALSVTKSQKSVIGEDGLLGVAILQTRFPEHSDILLKRYRRIVLENARRQIASGQQGIAHSVARAMLPDFDTIRALRLIFQKPH